MPSCEKCWRDAGYIALSRMSDKVDEYRALLEERKDKPCSPEEQCGDMHIILQWKDRPDQCLCGKVVRPREAIARAAHKALGGE